MKKLLLASKSPRRYEILSQFGFDFLSHPIEVSEILNKNLNLDEQIQALACQKIQMAKKTSNHLELKNFILISADTLVVLDGRVLGKPKDADESIRTLGQLSGCEHEVKTAVALFNGETGELSSFVETTKVWFRELSKDEIQSYVLTGEPLDKAGSYGIQGRGNQFVEKYEGSYWNVVGLPVERLKKKLQELNWLITCYKTQRDVLRENLEIIRRKMNKKNAQLVAISKSKSSEDIFTVYECGQRVFGESYVQEALEKQKELKGRAPDIEWHFVGRLQKNKIKNIVGRFELIHSIDREEVLLELENRVEKRKEKLFKQKILLQVNLAKEENRGGVFVRDLLPLVRRASESTGVQFCGLMCILPDIMSEKIQRDFFRQMKKLGEQVQAFCQSPVILSMGMSRDFELALEEGANMIRLGTGVFGMRRIDKT